MFAFFDRPAAAPIALVVAVCLAVAGTGLGLAHDAAAGDDLGLRRAEFWPEQTISPALVARPSAAVTALHRRPRRIWAASRSRPLRVTLARRGGSLRRARYRLAQIRAAQNRAGQDRRIRSAEGAVRASPKPVLTLPKPNRTALVSIYRDRTLRDGDAVMMADGIHLFHGGASWPHRPDDFLRLQSVVRLGWSLRHTLSDIDSAPPSRWSLAGTGTG